jgi:hypothetical protein
MKDQKDQKLKGTRILKTGREDENKASQEKCVRLQIPYGLNVPASWKSDSNKLSLSLNAALSWEDSRFGGLKFIMTPGRYRALGITLVP